MVTEVIMNTLTINNVSNNVELGSFFESLLFTANTVLGLRVICIVVRILKASYVLRCIAQHGLEQEVR